MKTLSLVLFSFILPWVAAVRGNKQDARSILGRLVTIATSPSEEVVQMNSKNVPIDEGKDFLARDDAYYNYYNYFYYYANETEAYSYDDAYYNYFYSYANETEAYSYDDAYYNYFYSTNQTSADDYYYHYNFYNFYNFYNAYKYDNYYDYSYGYYYGYYYYLYYDVYYNYYNNYSNNRYSYYYSYSYPYVYNYSPYSYYTYFQHGDDNMFYYNFYNFYSFYASYSYDSYYNYYYAYYYYTYDYSPNYDFYYNYYNYYSKGNNYYYNSYSFYNYYASKYAYYYYEMASNNECASVESAAYHAQQHANGGYVESDMCFCSTLCGIYRDDFLYDCYVKIENATCKTKMDTKWLVGFYSFAGLIAAWLLALLLYFVWMDGKRRGGGTQSMPMSTQIEMEPDDENTRGGMDMRGDFELVSSVSSHGAGAVERNSRSDGGRVVDFRSSDNKSATMMQDISLHDEEDNDIHHLPLASDDEDQNAVTSAIHQNSEQV